MKDTIKDRVTNYLRNHGARTSDQIMDTIGITRAQCYNVMSRLGIKLKDGLYALPADEEATSIVRPRVVNVLHTNEMTGYDAMMRRGRELRDLAAKTTGVSPNPWRVPT